jgi:hypothetical protein
LKELHLFVALDLYWVCVFVEVGHGVMKAPNEMDKTIIMEIHQIMDYIDEN